MLSDFALLAQAVETASGGDSVFMKFVYVALVLLGCFVLPFVVGRAIARAVRLNDHGWKIGLVLCCVLISAFIIYGTYETAKPAAAEVKFTEPNSAITISAGQPGVEFNGTAIEFEDSLDESGDAARATYDAASRQLSVAINAGATTAKAVVEAINAEPTKTFNAKLTSEADQESDGSGLVGITSKSATGGGPSTFNIKLGVDLKGGVILIYEVDQSATEAAADPNADPNDPAAGTVRMGALVEALARRINPSGTKEIVIRPYGAQQVEVIIPEVDQREVDIIKGLISDAGVLAFRIVANGRDHADLIADARKMESDAIQRLARFVRNDAGEQIGLWAAVGRDTEEEGGTFKVDVSRNITRDASTGEIVDLSGAPSVPDDQDKERREFTKYVDGLGIGRLEVLMATDDGFDVQGKDLGAVSRGTDESLRPCILFNLKSAGGGVVRFAELTTEFGPEGNFSRQLGIVLDNALLSAPNIQEPITGGSGRITGQFTKDEVEFMVNILEAGSLPVVLNKIPISESQISPLLGAETIKQGKFAISFSLVLVLIFIAFYYRFAGVVACLALMLNLLFVLALMILIKGAFTLPGLAGLVLTVGMSVDANVLIFERIREELSRGAALRMAIRNGFSKATTTIVDANVTTLITAFVLYAIGTDQIRGFAVTLILGILMSMFTAIFCARIAFDLAERSRWLTQLSMMQILSATQINFVGKRRLAGVFSLILIVVGVAGIVSRKSGLFDIDFNGGTSVQMRLTETMNTDDVRNLLQTQFDDLEQEDRTTFSVTALRKTSGATANTNFKVDSSIEKVEDLEDVIRDAFKGRGSDGKSLLATYSLEFDPNELHEVALQIAPPETSEPSTEQPGESPAAPETTPPTTTEEAKPSESDTEASKDASDTAKPADGATDEKAPAESSSKEGAADEPCDSTDEVLLAQAETPTEAQPAASEPADEPSATAPAEPSETAAASEGADTETAPAVDTETAPAADGDAATQPADESGASDAEETPAEAAPTTSVRTDVDLTFEHKISAQTLAAELKKSEEALGLPSVFIQLINAEWNGESSNAFNDWSLRVAANKEHTAKLLAHVKSEFDNSPVWPASSKIGGQVAGKMKQKAIAALVASLFGIVLYIWIRFQRVIFGLAAVVALVHDVLVTLGAIAVSAWFADALGFLLIEEFKISLPIVAALLTIIGYSLNDTIVVFDRIREVRGKSPDLSGDMINRSINQTLSRTMLTSLTTLVVVVILYAMGGSGIHGFAFSLVVGVAIGTYSSIFVASPVLLLMTGANKPAKKPAKVTAAA